MTVSAHPDSGGQADGTVRGQTPPGQSWFAQHRSASALAIINVAFGLVVVLLVVTGAVLNRATDRDKAEHRAEMGAIAAGIVALTLTEIFRRTSPFRGSIQSAALQSMFGEGIRKKVADGGIFFNSQAPGDMAARLTDLADLLLSDAYPTAGQKSEGASRSNTDAAALLGALANDSDLAGHFVQARDLWVSELSSNSSDSEREASNARFGAAIASLRFRIEKRIDVFRTSVESKWRLTCVFLSFAISLMTAAVITALSRDDAVATLGTLAASATIGSVLAWVGSDILRLLESQARAAR